MNVVTILLAIAWFIRIFGNLVSFIALWWIKEYRIDRMMIQFRTSGLKLLFFPPYRLPPLSPKTMTIFLLASVSIVSFLLFSKITLIIELLIVDLLLFSLTLIFVELLSLPTKIYHRILISLAISKLRAHKGLYVIGITGSYGKTSVKDYLTTILSSKFRVLKTEASKNSPIGIAEVVLSKLHADHEIFVVEMGAYKRGEIREMTNMVRPQIGIITAINPQHQDLFGTIENTMAAKYELIVGLTGKKMGIFNGDDPRVRQMSQWAKRDGKQVRMWSIENAQDVRADLDGVQFTLNTSVHVKSPVLGEHQVSNILAAIVAAHACGMNISEAAKAATEIKPAKGVMQKIKGVNGSLFIDDTFNNNPDGAKAAIAFLEKMKGRKILVFQPMIELGSYALISHREVGKFAERVCDEIILTNNSYEKKLHGKVMNTKDATDYLQKNIKKGDTVLFKGKEAGKILKLCLEK